jgi:ribosome-interacting GTPase 1
MKITFQTPPKILDEKILYNVLRDYKMLNCEVLVRDENGMSIRFTYCPNWLLIWKFCSSHDRRLHRRDHERSPQVYPLVCHSHPSLGLSILELALTNITPSLYVYNKIDSVSLEFLDQLAREPHTAVMSCELDLGVQEVVERIWKELRLMRLYTKR